MSKVQSFSELEATCHGVFDFLRPLWHLWTPEDVPVILPDNESYKAAMSILAICSKLCPDVSIITYELMSNHLHIISSSPADSVQELFTYYRRFLRRYLRCRGLSTVPEVFDCSLREIQTLEEARNVVVYSNRNGFVVTPDSSPFSYPWGANQYYYNTEAKQRFIDSRAGKITQEQRRKLIHSHISDRMADPPLLLDGYACPLCFCNIDAGEKLFRNAAHYFHEIAKNIESSRQVAAQIGERIYYNDDDLYSVVQSICKNSFNLAGPALLPAESKIEVAKQIHFEYNAGNKQIARIMKMDRALVDSLFPMTVPHRNR